MPDTNSRTYISLEGDLIPHSNDTYNIGQPGKTYKDVHATSVYQGGNKVLDVSSDIPSDKIASLSDYQKATSSEPIVSTDTLNQAIGKLEYKVDNASINWSNIQDKPDFASVATSGNYEDLTHKPDLASVATSGSYNDLIDKPDFANVATSGNYEDLTHKPELANVATSGSYNDLIDKPTIPESIDLTDVSSDIISSTNETYDLGSSSKLWNNIYGKTIYQGTNQVLDTDSNLSASKLQGIISLNNLPPELNAIKTVPTYSDLPTENLYDGMRVLVEDASGDPTVTSGWAEYAYFLSKNEWVKLAEGENLDLILDWDNIQNKPDFANVATSGNYEDLTHKPDLANVATSGSYNDLTDKPTIPEATNASNQITAMTGYSKASDSSEISPSDSLNQAIGKLEYKVDNSGSSIDLTNVETNIIPSTNATYNLGSSEKAFNNLHICNLLPYQGRYSIDCYTNFKPVSDGACTIGDSDRRWAAMYTNAFNVAQQATFTGTTYIYGTLTLDADANFANPAKGFLGLNTESLFKRDYTGIIYTMHNMEGTPEEKREYLEENFNVSVGASLVPMSTTLEIETGSDVVYGLSLGLASKPWYSVYGTKLYQNGNQVLDSTSTFASDKVTSLTNYQKASSSEAIAVTDTLNQALGKLEYKVDNTSINWTDIQDKPDFASVATSGSYDDLSNKPTIPAATDASNQITAMTGYNKPSSATAISPSDTLNQAIGKLEYKIDNAGGSSIDLTNVSSNIIPSTNETYDLGQYIIYGDNDDIIQQPKGFRNLYVGAIRGNGTFNWYMDAIEITSLLPENNDYSYIGTDSRPFTNITAEFVVANTAIRCETIEGFYDEDYNLKPITLNGDIIPDDDNEFKLGSSSYKFSEIHSAKFYQNGNQVLDASSVGVGQANIQNMLNTIFA